MTIPRPEHAPEGDPCGRCGLAAPRHRTRARGRAEYFKGYRKEHPSPPRKREPREPQTRTIIALDGEGHTDARGRHLYVYLAASSKEGLVSNLYDERGLKTGDVLSFLLALPQHSLKVGFALQYDWTKWLEDLQEEHLYRLWRPELRPGKHGPRPIRCHVGGERFSLNMIATRLTIGGRWKEGEDGEPGRFTRSVSVWDLFRFYQRSFVASLKEWGCGTPGELEAIQAMKERRGVFKGIGERERLYCQHETRLLAALCERLVEACEEAGLELRDFYGAGSLGAATLREGPAKSQKARIPAKMLPAVACAFFGGRFEISRAGPVPIAHGYDLASAYPYAETQLPCLKHGKWIHVSGTHAKVLREVRAAKAACVRYELAPRPNLKTRSALEVCEAAGLAFAMPPVSDSARVSTEAWGPFPFRLPDGSILFPIESSGGWIWKGELLAALDAPHLWPNVRALEAWTFISSTCKCGSPYLAEVGDYYRRRLEWGKDAKGLVLKKGLASRYGKRAQTVGKAPFHCPVAAGMITSHTRAEILRAIAAAPDPWSILSVATDGIICSELLELRKPEETGTGGKKPLGMWEHKPMVGGAFLCRPGQRFSLELSEGVDTTAARGIGIKLLHDARRRVLETWERKPGTPVAIKRNTSFHGAKLSITTRMVRQPRKKDPRLSELDERVLAELPEDHRALYLRVRRGLKGTPRERADAMLQYAHEHPLEVLESIEQEAEAAVRELRSGEMTFHRAREYGKWSQPDDFRVSYSPLPKRPAFGPDWRLFTWALGPEDGTSKPYDRIANIGRRDILELRRAQDEAEAQPDGELPGIGDDL